MDPLKQTESESHFKRGFSPEICIACGKCLSGCRYLNLTPKEARKIIKDVIEKPAWHPVLSGCLTCGKCEHRCPKGAHPSLMMLELLNLKRNTEPHVSPSLAYALNGMETEGWHMNFFKDIFNGLGKKEKNILKHWAVPKTGKDLFWAGCGFRMLPDALESSHTLRNLHKFGGPDDCCGIFAIKGGLLDEGYRIAARLIERLKKCRFNRLIVACGHCQEMFVKIIPEVFGLDFPFQTVSIFEYLQKMADTGMARVVRPLHLNAAISDACFGYEIGNDYLDAVRQLSATIGINLSELPHNREEAACCGLGGYLTDGKLRGFIQGALIKRKDFLQAGQKHIVSYCQGCHLMNHYAQPGYQSHFLLEDALTAFGETVTTPNSILHRRLVRPHIIGHFSQLAKNAVW
ncbi:MAG: (Fe-S)-binding protein [Proteobacteria bacterium]|nr:(Fe-S)-binding protein [Pseudomonadota bacterium]